MTQEFLDSLAGLSLRDAVSQVEDLGLTPFQVQHGVNLSLLARGDTVILWVDSDGRTVRHATPGDPLQLETEIGQF